MSDHILETQHLTKSFGEFVAVDRVNLRVRPNTVHAVIGPNGAGKTTLFNLLTKFLQPSEGAILFKGREITRMKPAQIARLGIVRSFQISAIFPELTVQENLRVALARPLGLSFKFWRPLESLKITHSRIAELMEMVGVAQFKHTRAADLPYGHKRALELATTLALDPELVLLDEPMAGLGQEDIAHISALIGDLRGERTVVMVEHNLSVVANISDTITVLQRGAVLSEGAYADVSRDPKVIEAYMGGVS